MFLRAMQFISQILSHDNKIINSYATVVPTSVSILMPTNLYFFLFQVNTLN